MNGNSARHGDAERAHWMGLLATADLAVLDACWNAMPAKPAYTLLRRPETGLVMVRGRMGGAGGPFNLGEMTATRCAVRLADGTVGHGYVGGRNPRHAELAALFDALLQRPASAPDIAETLLAPLENARQARHAVAAEQAAATRVQFFTVVRGED